MAIRNLLFTILITLPSLVRAQSSQILEQYVQAGLAANLSLRQKDLELNLALEKIQEAKAHFYPKFTFAPTYSVAAGGRKLQFPVGDLLNPAYQALNELKGSNLFPTNIQNVNELLAPNNFHDTKVSFQYALYNPEIRYNFLIQKSQLSAREASKKIVENELRYTIETAYYQYMQAAEGLKMFDHSKTVLEALVKLNQKFVDHQVLTRDAVFSAEYELSNLERQRSQALKNKKVAGAYFNYLLYRPATERIEEDTLLMRADLSPESGRVSSLGTSPHQRQEIKQIDYAMESAQQALQMHKKSANTPSFFLGGNAGFQGYGYTFTNQAYLLAQVGLQWDIFKGYERKSKISQAKIQTDILKNQKSELESRIDLEITQARYTLEAAQESIGSTVAAVTKAEQYFKITDSRYRNHQVLLMEYIKAQNDVFTARIQYTLAKYDILIQRALLQKVLAVP